MISRPGIFIAALAISMFASPVFATITVPSAANCSVESVLVGDSNGMLIGDGFRVTVRDLQNNPLAGSTVALEFAGSAARPYTSQVDGSLVACPSIRGVTSGAGLAVFHARFGGYANAPVINVRADGILIATVRARSTDIDGDGVTGVNDLNLFRHNFLQAPAALETDFDETGSTDLGDFNLFRQVFLNDVPGTPCP